MSSRKRQTTEEIEPPNQEKITKVGEKETYKYLGIQEVDTIKQVIGRWLVVWFGWFLCLMA